MSCMKRDMLSGTWWNLTQIESERKYVTSTGLAAPFKPHKVK
jgi:hypothetical protein